VLATGAWGQWYGRNWGYADPGYGPYPSYYPLYSNPGVSVVYPPRAPFPQVVVVNETPAQEYAQTRQITYLIAFKDNVIRAAIEYWVNGNILYYVTLDHERRTAVLDSVDRVLSERLNSEQNVPFYLPAEHREAELWRRLEQQLNLILETRHSARGLIVSISDVQFDFNKHTLTPWAREKLAKVAGILLAYSGLCPQLEGYTDNIGGDEYNLRLSRMRADAVRQYLISQGVPPGNVTAVGMGRAAPVAPNDTAAGRQQNRRVEMVLSGDAIGIAVTAGR
jgi:outer membrane protein OmpA-like peptidoglycan-associated protein